MRTPESFGGISVLYRGIRRVSGVHREGPPLSEGHMGRKGEGASPWRAGRAPHLGPMRLGLGGGGNPKGGAPLAWGASPLPLAAPPTIFAGGGRREEGGGKEGEAESPLSIPFPSFLLLLVQPIWGAHQPLVAGAFPLLAHKAHIFCRGCPEPLPVTR